MRTKRITLLLFSRIDLDPPDLDVVEVPLVVKRPDSNLPPFERLVAGFHDGLFHVVEVGLNRPVGNASDDLELMPLVVPRGAFGGLGGDLGPGLSVDDEDLVGVIVGLLAEMDVIAINYSQSTTANPPSAHCQAAGNAHCLARNETRVAHCQKCYESGYFLGMGRPSKWDQAHE